MKFALKKYRYIIIGFLAFLTVLPVLLLFYLSTGPGERWLRVKLEEQIKGATGLETVIETLQTNVVSHLQLDNISLSQVIDQQQHTLFEAEKIEVSYSLWELFTFNFTIDSLVLDNAVISIRKDESGIVNIPSFGGEDNSSENNSGSLIAFHLNRVSLNNGTFIYDDLSIPLQGMLSDFSVRILQSDEKTYSFHTRSDSGRLVYEQTSTDINAMDIKGVFAGDTIVVEQFLFEIPGMKSTGDAAINTAVSPSTLSGNFLTEIDHRQISFLLAGHLPPYLLPTMGTNKISTTIAGTLDEYVITMSSEFPKLRVNDLDLLNGSIKGEYRNNTLSLNQFTTEVLGGKISASGSVVLDSVLTHQLTFGLNDVNLSDSWYYVHNNASPYKGTAKGTVRSSGSFSNIIDLRLDGDMKLMDVFYQARPLADFNTTVHLADGRLTLDSRQGSSAFAVNIDMSDDELSGSFSTHVVDIKRYAGIFNFLDLEGALRAQGTFSGSANKPEFVADVTANRVIYRNFPIDSLKGKVLYKNDTFSIVNATLKGKLDKIDTLRAPFDVENLGGGFSYRGVLKGDLDNISAEISAQLLQPSYDIYEFDKGYVSASYTNEVVSFHPLKLQKDSLTIHTVGEYHLDDSTASLNHYLSDMRDAAENMFDFHNSDVVEPVLYNIGSVHTNTFYKDSVSWKVHVTGEKLAIEKVIPYYSDSLNIGGNIDFALNYNEALPGTYGDVKFSIDSLLYENIVIDALSSSAQLVSDRLIVDSFELIKDNNVVRGSGAVALTKATRGNYTITGADQFEAVLASENIDLSVAKPFLPDEMHLTGNSSFDLAFQGSLGDPIIKGELRIKNSLFTVNKETPPLQLNEVIITAQDSLFIIRDFSGTLREVPFGIKGRVNTRDWEKFHINANLQVNSFDVFNSQGFFSYDSLHLDVLIDDFDLANIEGFYPDLKKTKGILNSRLSFRGAYTDPQINGAVQVRDIQFQQPLLSQTLTGGIIKATFDQKQVTIDSLFFKINKGTIFASGNFSHAQGDVTGANVAAAINNIVISEPKEYVIDIQTGNLQYQKRDDQFILDGDIVLGKSSLLHNYQPTELLSFFNTTLRPAQPPPFLVRQTRLNIRIKESDNLWVDNNLARMRLSSELTVIGSLPDPVITGRVIAKEGYLLYLDRKFQIQRGTLDFIDPNRTNPIVDLQATANLKGYQTLSRTPYNISFSITGPMDAATFALTSDPVLEKSDIVSLLTVGATRQELTGKNLESGNVSLGNVLRERAEQLSSQRISGYTSQKIGTLLGLNEMTIEGNLFNFSQNWGPQLLVSKKLSDQIELSYSTRVGQSNNQAIRLDYSFSRYFSLQGQTNQQGRTGFDLKFRLKNK